MEGYFLPYFKGLIMAYKMPKEWFIVALKALCNAWSTALEGHFVKSKSLS